MPSFTAFYCKYITQEGSEVTMTGLYLFNLIMAASILTPAVIGLLSLKYWPDKKLDERLEEVENAD